MVDTQDTNTCNVRRDRGGADPKNKETDYQTGEEGQ